MIVIENVTVRGIEEAIRGMRNPLNSWDKSDSYKTYILDEHTLNSADYQFFVGDDDLKLMEILALGGPVHGKYKRMIQVYADITAPLYWWKEFDTYKIGTVANSCSTMHTIHREPLTLDNFSVEHLGAANVKIIENLIDHINSDISLYKESKDKHWWWQIIQMLPSSFNQKRTVMLNYEVLTNIFQSRRYHKLDEWWRFCEWIDTLPYAPYIVTGTGLKTDGETE